jgi:hypothetical protein
VRQHFRRPHARLLDLRRGQRTQPALQVEPDEFVDAAFGKALRQRRNVESPSSSASETIAYGQP